MCALLARCRSLGLTSFAIAEDIHALGVVFFEILFTGALIPSSSGGISAGEGELGERLANLYTDVFRCDLQELKEYCWNEVGWQEVTDLLDENEGAGWELLSMMVLARERARDLANDKTTVRVLTCEGLLGSQFWGQY